MKRRAAVSVNSSMDLAEVRGVPTVVFVSDACRDVSGALTMQQFSPGPVFPILEELSKSVCKVDLIRATLRGAAAYEIPIVGDEVSPLLSHALRAAYSELEHPWRSTRSTIATSRRRRRSRTTPGTTPATATASPAISTTARW